MDLLQLSNVPHQGDETISWNTNEIENDIFEMDMNYVTLMDDFEEEFNGVVEKVEKEIKTRKLENNYFMLSEYLRQIQEYPEQPKTGELKIVTMTIIASLNHFIDIQKIFTENILSKDVIYCVTLDNKVIVHKDMIHKQKQKRKKKTNKTKKFYNQISIIIKPYPERDNGIDMKIYINGSIQMTGCKSQDEAKMAVEKMIDVLYHYDPSIFKRYTSGVIHYSSFNEKRSVKITDVELSKMISCTSYPEVSQLKKGECFEISNIIQKFDFHFEINRDAFHKILENIPNWVSILDTSSYPGINCQIYYNKTCTDKEHPIKKNIYQCDCRLITCFIFRSGSIIISGCRSLDQVYYAYEQLKKHATENYKHIVVHQTQEEQKINKIYRTERNFKNLDNPEIMLSNVTEQDSSNKKIKSLKFSKNKQLVIPIRKNDN